MSAARQVGNLFIFFFFSSRRRHTRLQGDWSSDVCSSDCALSNLTADQRETVILKIYQGFKFEEIAEIVAAPVSTVKSRLYTALDLLKAELAPVKARGVS